MNYFVADPHWRWWIVWYFFLGGIAAGAYFTAALIELCGRDEDRRVARIGYFVAFPLIVVCGVLLILDLSRPERFWHMLFRSETVGEAIERGWPLSIDGWGWMIEAPLVKYWSPMSVGSWAITLFGLTSGWTFWASLRPRGWAARLLGRPWIGYPVRLAGCGVGFFVAAYTGALLTATSQPLWSESTWIAALFLTSAASTGTAAMLLVSAAEARLSRKSRASARLERADTFELVLELVVLAAFLISLGALLPVLLTTVHGWLLVAGTLVIGIVAPLAIRWRVGTEKAGAMVGAAILVLAGGFVMRYAILGTPAELLAQRPPAPSPEAAAAQGGFGPEAGRSRGAGLGSGADPDNRAGDFVPRSKLFSE